MGSLWDLDKLIPLTKTLWFTDCTKAQIGLGYLRQIDPINRMIPFTVIPLSGLHCIQFGYPKLIGMSVKRLKSSIKPFKSKNINFGPQFY